MIVKVELPPPVVFTVSGPFTCPLLPAGSEIEAGEQLAPEGSPEQVKVTVPENPPCGFT